MAAKKKSGAKSRKSGRRTMSSEKCVYGVMEDFVGASEIVGLYSTQAKAKAVARAKSAENPKFDYRVSRLCVR